MARHYRMSWEARSPETASRWSKMYHGKRYQVTVAELGVASFTKDGSAAAANEWWDKKLVELGAPRQAAQQHIENLTDRLTAVNIDLAKIETKKAIAATIPAELAIEMYSRIDRIVPDIKPGETCFRLETQAEAFLAVERVGDIKPRTYGEISASLRAIIRMSPLSADMDVRSITAKVVESFYVTLKRSGKAKASQKKLYGFFCRLVRYCWQHDIIDLPKNLDTFSFGIVAHKIKTYDRAEVAALIVKLPPRLRLYALLGLNCGMLSVDIGNLRQDQIDFGHGTITRKRTKTENEENVPEVTYRLWPETLALLRQCRSEHATWALTTKAGTQLVRHWIEPDENGVDKEREANMVRQQWKRAETDIPHNAFRSISASLLETHEHYGRYAPHFLAHSPKSIADRHYRAPSQELFDSALVWLRSQLLA